jgi:hypothetical protein
MYPINKVYKKRLDTTRIKLTGDIVTNLLNDPNELRLIPKIVNQSKQTYNH